jgi:hypothetical protein
MAVAGLGYKRAATASCRGVAGETAVAAYLALAVDR